MALGSIPVTSVISIVSFSFIWWWCEVYRGYRVIQVTYYTILPQPIHKQHTVHMVVRGGVIHCYRLPKYCNIQKGHIACTV